MGRCAIRRLGFLIAALNNLEVLAADVRGAYLNAPTTEKVYTIAGTKFGSNAGQPAKLVKALYGLRSSGARWRDQLAAALREYGYRNCQADPDVWMRPGVKANGEKIWNYVLCYVDDILCINTDPKLVMDFLAYTLKKGSV
jgi:hypothetical protein